MPKKKERKLSLEYGEPATIFGKETEFRGNLYFEKPLQINGYFEGEIEAKGLLIISPTATVKANIHAQNVVVAGKLYGNIVADQKVELLDTAEHYGNIKTMYIYIEDGAIFEGNCERLADAVSPKSAS